MAVVFCYKKCSYSIQYTCILIITFKLQNSRQPSSTSQSPFYLHPPDDISNPKTSPPSPCSHHTPPDGFDNDSHYSEIANRDHFDEIVMNGNGGINSIGHEEINGNEMDGRADSPNHSRSNSNGSGNSLRSHSRNSNESHHSNSDSMNSSTNNSAQNSSSSSMLQDLREMATHQQQILEDNEDCVPEPFYLHDSDSPTAGNRSPLQKLFNKSINKDDTHTSQRKSSTNQRDEGWCLFCHEIYTVQNCCMPSIFLEYLYIVFRNRNEYITI